MPHTRLRWATVAASVIVWSCLGCATTQNQQRMTVILPVEPQLVAATVRRNTAHIVVLANQTLYESRIGWRQGRFHPPLKKISDGVKTFVAAPEGVVYVRGRSFYYKGEKLHIRLPTDVPPLAVCEAAGKLYAWFLVAKGKRAKRLLWRGDQKGGNVLFDQEGWGVVVWVVAADSVVVAGNEKVGLLLRNGRGEIVEHNGLIKGGAVAGGELWLAYVSGGKLLWRQVGAETNAIRTFIKSLRGSGSKQQETEPIILVTGYDSFGVWRIRERVLQVYWRGEPRAVGLASVRNISIDRGAVYRMLWRGGRVLAIQLLSPQTR